MIERLAAQVAGHRSRALLVPEELGGASLAGRIAQELSGDGYQVIEVFGLPELRDHPLAALGPVIAGNDPDEAVADRLHRLYSALAPSRVRALLVVDGVEHLDDDTAAVIHQLVRAYGIRALLVGSGPLPDALARLRATDDLAELSDIQTHEEWESLRLQTILRALGVASVADLEWAARATRAADDPDLATRLARRAIEAAEEQGEPTPAGALVVFADGLSLTGRLDDADAAWEVALASAEGAHLAEAAQLAAMHWTVRRRDTERGAAAIDAVLHRIQDPTDRAMVETMRDQVRFMGGGAPPPESGADAPSGLRSLIFRMHAGAFTGELDDVRAAIALARPLVLERPEDGRPYGEVIEFAAFLELIVDGRVNEAAAHVHAVRAEHGEPLNGAWDYAVALPRLLRGDLPGAARAAERAVRRLAERDYINAAGPASGLHATALAQAGKWAAARLALAGIKPGDRLSNVPTDLQAAEAEAWLLAGAGDREGAVATIADAMRRGLEAKHTTFGALTGATAIRLGQPDAVLEMMRDAAALAPQSGLVSLLLEYAEAAAQLDGALLLASAARLATAGLLGAAADAATLAAKLDSPGAMALAVSYRVGGAGRMVDPTGANLSRREWDVVSAAAERLRNREIAERLGLSVRTVENYLASAFRKLEVSRRDELAARLQS